MKDFNKQILEAVRRGIQLALDDYQDIEPNSSISQDNDVIDNNDIIKQRIELDKITVDLGLPSGTIWAKYNLGVDPNKLSKPEDWYGDYYAWGETIPNKPEYNLETYQFKKNIFKYNKEDHLTELQLMDDVAYQNMHLYNFKFKMPTKEQFEELIEETNNEWVENFNNNGVNGYKFTNKSDSSKYIFLPAAGYYYDSDLIRVGEVGYYWSSSLYTGNPNSAWSLCFNNGEVYMSHFSRYNGFSVRPVLNKYSLYESSLNLSLDDFDFNDNIESNHISDDDIISINEQLFAQHIVERINLIDVKNAITIELVVKRQIRKLYKLLRKHLGNKKYIATSREELKNLIKHIVVINPKENLNWIDTSRITSMYAMFDDFISKKFCGNVSDWDMSNVTNTRNMFYRCEKFNCDLSKWDVSNVRLMGNMFSECCKFNSNISKWNVSNVTEMSGLFSGCHNFNQDISKWDVSNVTDMAWMFTRCRKFDQDLSGWDVSNVTKNSGFYHDTEFSKHPEKVPNFDINKTMGNI